MDTNVLCRARFWWSLSCNAMNESYRAWSKVTFLRIAPETYGLILAVCVRVNFLLVQSSKFIPTHIFLHNDSLQLALRRHQSVIWQRFPTQKDVEHQRDALETKEVISTLLSATLSGSHRKRRTDRFAGISILSWGGSCFPSTIGRSEFSVCISFSTILALPVSPRPYVFIELNA